MVNDNPPWKNLLLRAFSGGAGFLLEANLRSPALLLPQEKTYVLGAFLGKASYAAWLRENRCVALGCPWSEDGRVPCRKGSTFRVLVMKYEHFNRDPSVFYGFPSQLLSRQFHFF